MAYIPNLQSVLKGGVMTGAIAIGWPRGLWHVKHSPIWHAFFVL